MRIFNKFFLVLSFQVIAFSIGCKNNSKRHASDNNKPELSTFLMITKSDSALIKKCNEGITRVDTLFSATRCTETINYFNSTGIVVLRKSIQHCMADTRMKWKVDSYFNVEGSSSLHIFYDGVGNVVEIIR